MSGEADFTHEEMALVFNVTEAVKELNRAMAQSLKYGLRTLITVGHGAGLDRSISVEVVRFKSWRES